MSMAARSPAGHGRANRNPWIWSQPSSVRRLSWPGRSTPSATQVIPRPCASWMIPPTIAASRGFVSSAPTKAHVHAYPDRRAISAPVSALAHDVADRAVVERFKVRRVLEVLGKADILIAHGEELTGRVTKHQAQHRIHLQPAAVEALNRHTDGRVFERHTEPLCAEWSALELG